MAKIAVTLNEALAVRAAHHLPGATTARLIAGGAGWTVSDVVCTCGPRDRPYEERHALVRIAIVVAGTFQYRGESGTAWELMTPGSVLLGNEGECFECAHAHGAGDRCLSFGYRPDYFARVAADAGIRDSAGSLPVLRLPALRVLSPLIARAWAGLTGAVNVSWEELGLRLAAQTAQLARSIAPNSKDLPVGAVGRVTRVVREIERHPEGPWTLANLAQNARLSAYHFLRTFESLTGTTPHQFLLRCRLRSAAVRLMSEPTKVLDVAFDCGFGDVSNFNRAFRNEFGVSPRAYRRHAPDHT